MTTCIFTVRILYWMRLILYKLVHHVGVSGLHFYFFTKTDMLKKYTLELCGAAWPEHLLIPSTGEDVPHRSNLCIQEKNYYILEFFVFY